MYVIKKGLVADGGRVVTRGGFLGDDMVTCITLRRQPMDTDLAPWSPGKIGQVGLWRRPYFCQALSFTVTSIIEYAALQEFFFQYPSIAKTATSVVIRHTFRQ